MMLPHEMREIPCQGVDDRTGQQIEITQLQDTLDNVMGRKADPESPRKGRRCTLVIKLALVGSDQEIWSNM